jgi:hypothetical protein
MTRRRIDRFLATLAAELRVPARAYVTGAAAAALWGRVRPSLDIDLGIELRTHVGGPTGPAGRRRRGAPARDSSRAHPPPPTWATVEAAVARTTALTGIPTSAAEDIDRWGMITLLDYRRTSRLYRRFEHLEVRLLDPRTWAIGKLTRYLDPDVRDVAEVFRRQRVDAKAAARLWGRALRASPASTAQFQFRRHVELFLQREGRHIWGRAFAAADAITEFHRAARIAAEPR